MNAVVASGIAAKTWASRFDTVSICFSKGLGAPVGSAVAGTKEIVKKAHRLRKLLGGGMRQAGILAAAALHALDHHVERLAEDHAHAKLIGESVSRTTGLRLESAVETNLVWIEVDPRLGTAGEIAAKLRFKVCSSAPWVRKCCERVHISTFRDRPWNEPVPSLKNSDEHQGTPFLGRRHEGRARCKKRWRLGSLSTSRFELGRRSRRRTFPGIAAEPTSSRGSWSSTPKLSRRSRAFEFACR